MKHIITSLIIGISLLLATDLIIHKTDSTTVSIPVNEIDRITFGIDSESNVNVALSSSGATATAISEGTYQGDTHYAFKAIDGDEDVFWASNWDMPAWLQVEFAQVYNIDSIGVWWGSHQHDFTISLSIDGDNWTLVENGTSNNSEGSSPVYELFPINSTDAKYVKIDITSTSAPSYHIFQAIVNEIEAYCNQ